MANEKTSYPPPYEQSQSIHTSYQHNYTTEYSPNNPGFQPNHPGFQQSQTSQSYQQSHPAMPLGFQQSQTSYQQSHPAIPPGFQPSHTEFQQNYPGFQPSHTEFQQNYGGFQPSHTEFPQNHSGNPGFQQARGELQQNNTGFQQNYIGSAGQLPDKAGNPASQASAPAPAQVPLTSVTQHGSSVHYVGPQHSFVPVVMSQAIPLGPSASTVVCPKCRETVTTRVRREASKLAWLGCCILAVIGCFCGCCLIPFCIKQCQIVHHTCPKCKTYLGKYSRLN